MYKKGLNIFIFSMITIILSGNAFAASGDLFRSGYLNLETQPEAGVRIKSMTAYAEKNSIEISGKIKKTGTGFVRNGHIDLTVVSPSGDILKKIKTAYIPGNLNLRKRHSHGSKFYAKLSDIPPEGSLIRVVFHN